MKVVDDPEKLLERSSGRPVTLHDIPGSVIGQAARATGLVSARIDRCHYGSWKMPSLYNTSMFGHIDFAYRRQAIQRLLAASDTSCTSFVSDHVCCPENSFSITHRSAGISDFLIMSPTEGFDSFTVRMTGNVNLSPMFTPSASHPVAPGIEELLYELFALSGARENMQRPGRPPDVSLSEL